MLRFIIRRVVIIVPMLFIIVSITWGLIRLAPGNFYLRERKLAPAVEKNLREKYGMDKPWYVQYGRFLVNAHFLNGVDDLFYLNRWEVPQALFEAVSSWASVFWPSGVPGEYLPAPKTTCNRPRATSRAARSTFSSESGVCA